MRLALLLALLILPSHAVQGQAWFEGLEIITFCVSGEGSTIASRDHVKNAGKAAFSEAYSLWLKYFVNKGILFPSNKRLRDYPMLVHYQDECVGSTNLIIYLNFADTNKPEILTQSPDILASAVLETKSKGHLRLNVSTTTTMEQQQKTLIEGRPTSVSLLDSWGLKTVLLHELGHVFGIPHIAGTIMDPKVVESLVHRFSASFELPTKLKSYLFADLDLINHPRDLFNPVSGNMRVVGRNLGDPGFVTLGFREGTATKISFHADQTHPLMEFNNSTAQTPNRQDIVEVLKSSITGAVKIYHRFKVDMFAKLHDTINLTYQYNSGFMQRSAHRLIFRCREIELTVFEALTSMQAYIVHFGNARQLIAKSDILSRLSSYETCIDEAAKAVASFPEQKITEIDRDKMERIQGDVLATMDSIINSRIKIFQPFPIEIDQVRSHAKSCAMLSEQSAICIFTKGDNIFGVLLQNDLKTPLVMSPLLDSDVAVDIKKVKSWFAWARTESLDPTSSKRQLSVFEFRLDFTYSPFEQRPSEDLNVTLSPAFGPFYAQYKTVTLK